MLRRFMQSQYGQATKLLRGVTTHPAQNSPKGGINATDGYMTRSEKCLNSVQILGRVGQDPKVAGSSKKVVQFSVATTVYYQPSSESAYSTSGGLQSKTSWHNVAVFRPYLQEKVENYIKKGSRVLVQGSLEYSTYTDENGNQRNNVSIIPDDVIILATPGRNEASY